MDHSTGRQIVALLIFLGLCALVSLVGSLVTMSAMNGWYESLEQPDWNPPDSVFGPVWTILYVAMAVSAWLVWRSRGVAGARLPLSIWVVQLGLNLLWTIVFFGLEMPGIAFVEIIFLWLAIVATIVLFMPVSRLAAILLIPYLGWVTFAAALNYSIWTLN